MYDKASIALIPSGTKASKLYSVLPANGDGDFTHTRGGTATRVNKDGLIETVAANVPRLDYPLTNGVVGDCPHLLLEPSRTNLQVRSEEFDNSAWAKTNSSVSPNLGVAPDGSNNADKLIADTSNNKHYIQDITSSLTGVHRASVFAKADGYDYIEIGERATGGARAVFNLSTGVIETEVASPNAKIENYGNGWYRCSIEETMSSSSFAFRISVSDNTTSDSSWTGNGVDGILIWGAQLEADYETSYIKTSGSAETRSADVCNDSGTSAEFNDSEGVLFAEIAAFANDSTTRQMSLSNGTTSNRIVLQFHNTTNQYRFFMISGGTTVQSNFYTISDISAFNKIAYKYEENNIKVYINGTQVITDTSATMPIGLDDLSFDAGNGANDLYGKVKQVIYFNEALSDSELQTLTS